MVFTRKKSRASANPESSPRNQPGTNKCEVRTPSWTVFIQEQNELFVQLIVQYLQEKECVGLHYHVLGLNESSTEDDNEKAYHDLDCQFHPENNKHSHASAVMLMKIKIIKNGKKYCVIMMQ